MKTAVISGEFIVLNSSLYMLYSYLIGEDYLLVIVP